MADTLPLRPSAPPASSLGDKWEAAGVKQGEVLAGRYRVDDVLGFGGMGAVLATTHLQLGSRLAVKLVRGQSKQSFVAERFVREARAASKLQCANAVRVFDVGRLENGVPYMVMELLEGHDLKDLLAKRGVIDPSMAADCIVQACRAVAEAHANGIVHRDIKPANLFLVTRGPGSGVVKVLDFGISKFLVPSAPEDAIPLTNPETTLGSPKYMAPEQLVRPNEVDERADVWSLGVTLYELLVGKAPFRGPTDEYIARAVMVEYPLPPSMANPSVPEALSGIAMRCLEKDKKARFASAAELGVAIEKAMLQTRSPSLSPPPVMPTLHSTPPPPMPAATIPPPVVEPSEPSGLPRKGVGAKVAVGFVAMAMLGAAAVLLVMHERHPEHVASTTSSTNAITSASTTPTALATIPASEPTLSSVAPLKNTSSVTDTKPGKQPDPVCYAANIVCKRSYPECQSLRDYCDGKIAHPEAADSGAPLPGESPICTAARIVCDNKLEECESLTKKCLIAQQQPNP